MTFWCAAWYPSCVNWAQYDVQIFIRQAVAVFVPMMASPLRSSREQLFSIRSQFYAQATFDRMLIRQADTEFGQQNLFFHAMEPAQEIAMS